MTVAGRSVMHRGKVYLEWTGRWLGLPVMFLLVVVFWQGLVVVQGYEAFILPGPADVWQRLLEAAGEGILWQHMQATLLAALGGFALALSFSLVLGYVLAAIPWLERALAPLLAASVAMPVIALAPLIMLWFGAGLTSKLLVAALTAFFPMLIGTIVALHGVPRELRDMARISGANRWQMLRYVEFPLALPVLFGGVRTGLSLAIIGAVVGEFVSGRHGLGALINIARSLFDTPLIFVCLLLLGLLALGAYLLSLGLERLLVQWEA
ncbi:MAG: ABC transporter permease [Chloroflexaceae bacterium]|nr:ABC transporter permease [Chloroflexaceae bacterium]